MLAKSLAACTRLSTTVSQLFELQTIVIFTYPCLHFFFALEMPLWQSRKTLHEWIDNSVLAKPLAACTHLSSTVFQLFELQVQKIAVFTYRSPHFCFPWRRLCDYHALCCMDGKDNSMLAKPLAACAYLYSIVSELYDAFKSQCVSPKIAIFTTYLFPLGTPLGQSR